MTPYHPLKSGPVSSVHCRSLLQHVVNTFLDVMEKLNNISYRATLISLHRFLTLVRKLSYRQRGQLIVNNVVAIRRNAWASLYMYSFTS